ncbi:MFS transporter [Desulfococcaceae bacterium HSG9]|nr:MFS transporter [Desulfococcaceae bacterium HSG9]
MKNKNITVKGRYWVIGAALLALFLGALDALIMTAAMPTIIADMGGIHVYSWVYSAYLLARAVSLPIFGKLADLLKTRMLFLISISIFLVSSIVAGLAPDMTVLIFARVFQGIGAGGNFALVYIVLADIAPPGKRAKTLSLASSVWGIASVLGPTLGGFIVTYFSWRWVFFINIPTSLLAIALIAIFLEETRPKKTEAELDIAGAVTLSLSILGLLTLMMAGGRDFAWLSLESASLAAVTVIAGLGFYFVEKRAAEPILELRFFKLRGFSIGNGSVFLSSFVIFSLFAYAPLFIQGALGKTPMQVGIAMLSLSLGWSAGSFLLGQFSYKFGLKTAAIMGAVFLSVGSGFTLTFTNLTSMSGCFWVFLLIGAGMGIVTLSTLLVVQNSLDKSDLGVATTSHQFARSIGGTLGVGICGGLVTAKITSAINSLSLSGALDRLPADIILQIREHIERLFQPEFQSYLPPHVKTALQKSVGQGLEAVFWLVLIVSLICLTFCLCLPGGKDSDDR